MYYMKRYVECCCTELFYVIIPTYLASLAVLQSLHLVSYICILLPSTLARGSESRICSHRVRIHMRTYICTLWVMLRNVTWNVVTP